MKLSRQKLIMEILMHEGIVKTDDLVQKLGVSTETIRRDFAQLEKEGLLEKIYGGAISAGAVKQNELSLWETRRRVCMREKQVIALRAAEYIPANCLLALGCGTTIFELSALLTGKKDLSVITNDIMVAHQMMRNSNHSIFLIGGKLNVPVTFATYGFFAKEFLDNFSQIDICVFSAEGITCDDGLTTITYEINELMKLFIARSKKRIVILDHSKFNKKAIFKTCGFQQIDLLITDSRAPTNILDCAREEGVCVEVIPISYSGLHNHEQ